MGRRGEDESSENEWKVRDEESRRKRGGVKSVEESTEKRKERKEKECCNF